MAKEKSYQVHIRLSEEDRATVVALIDKLNREHALPGRRTYTTNGAVRFAIYEIAERRGGRRLGVTR